MTKHILLQDKQVVQLCPICLETVTEEMATQRTCYHCNQIIENTLLHDFTFQEVLLKRKLTQ